MTLRLAHGGSSTALKSDAAALAIIDEYDEMLRNVKGQGDPLGLVEARGFTYADFTVFVTSTPSSGAADMKRDPASGLDFWEIEVGEKMQSGVWSLWQQGSRHHWCWQCPHCKAWFVPRFELLHWPKNATPSQALEQAYMTCGSPDCGGIIEEHHKPGMNATGQFVAPGQTIDQEGNVTGEIEANSVASFWTSGLASPFVSFGKRAESYLLALHSGEQDKLQAVINAGFGQLWAPAGGEAPDVLEVHRLRIPYALKDVPVGVLRITAGIDVQKNRLIYVVRGWGYRGTSWLIDHGELWGATSDADVWEALDDLLSTRFAGRVINLAFIDSGFRPNKKDAGPAHTVYEFCRRHQHNTRPTKGYDTLASGPLSVSRIEIDATGGRAKFGLELVRLNTDWCKSWVHDHLRWPLDQPGAFFIPLDASDDYCQQLVSESRLRKPSGRVQWIARNRANHYLDCEAMAYAAGHMMSVQRLAGEKPELKIDPIAKEQVAVKVPVQTTAPPKPKTQAPQFTRSKFLSR